MHKPRNMSRPAAADLEYRYALDAALDEGLADEVEVMTMRLRDQGHVAQAQQLPDACRRHRVGALKFRTLKSALVAERD